MARVAFRQAEVTRMIKGALKAGLSRDSFEIVHRDDGLHLLPVGAPASSENEDLEKRMREAFGG